MADLDDMVNDFGRMVQNLDQNCITEIGKLATIANSETQLVSPVGQYPSGSGRTGGVLRRSMTVDRMYKNGDDYTAEYGPGAEAPYAQAVNDGHIQGAGFVKGRHFMEQGLQNAEQKFPDEIKGFLDNIFRA